MKKPILRCLITKDLCGVNVHSNVTLCTCDVCQQWAIAELHSLFCIKLWGEEGWAAYREHLYLINNLVKPTLKSIEEALEKNNYENAICHIKQLFTELND